MLDISPAINLAEHRAEAAVCGVYPILQRTHRAGAEERDAPDGDDAVGTKLAVEDEVSANLCELDLLGVEADQRGTTESGDGQQQQSSIAQAGEIAGAGGRHADEAGCRGWRCPPTRRGAAGLPQ